MSEQPDTTFDGIVSKLCNLSELGYTNESVQDSITFVAGNTEFFIPVTQKIDIEAEVLKLEEELNYTKGFLRSVEAKLGNEKFISGAPEKIVRCREEEEVGCC